MNREDPSRNQQKTLKRGPQMKKKYTIGVMIGNAISPHIVELIEGIYRASADMQIDVFFFLGIHSGYYYKLNKESAVDKDFDYQFNVIYDYQAFAGIDALIIEYGSLSLFLDKKEQKEFLKKFNDIPKVILEDRYTNSNTTSIISDNYNGMYMLTEHLIKDHGYRNFTYLAGPEGITDADERKQAVLDVMKKYNIPFDESRIRYGDFSSNAHTQVNELLDSFPHMEAMICANDCMAYTAYKECTKRGLIVGQNIAITGYDDFELAGIMDPPLTTVLQNSKDMGYMAVIGAIELCKGRHSHTIAVPTKVLIRESCGCHQQQILSSQTYDDEHSEWKKASDRKISEILKEVLSENSDLTLKLQFASCLNKLLESDFRFPESEKNVKAGLQSLMTSRNFRGLPIRSTVQHLEQYVDDWLETELNQPEIDRTAIQNLLLRKRLIHEKSSCYMVRREKNHMEDFIQQSCFLPLISRDMLSTIEDEQELYKSALIKLSALQAASSYLYILKEPIAHYKNENWICPDELYLAAFQEGNKVCSFEKGKRPKILANTFNNSYLKIRHANDTYNICVFCLFSGEIQYGILAAEIDPSNIILFYLVSRQIGNMLRLFQLSKEQRTMQRKLEQLVQEIQEKNEVLNFISESDPLTGCMNRRGFMEKAVKFNRENEGKEALILFADLDHLKEINDVFGHAEGDFAIKYCGEILRKMAENKGIVGRIGGDEFCVLIPGNAQTGNTFIEQIRSANNAFNLQSDKPYYIEISIGYTQIVCEKDLLIAEEMKAADQALYEAKKDRRKSIRK